MSVKLSVALLALTLGCSPGGVVPEGDSGIRDIGDSTGNNGVNTDDPGGGSTGTDGTDGGGTDGSGTDGGGTGGGGTDGTDGGSGGTGGGTGGGGTDGGGTGGGGTGGHDGGMGDGAHGDGYDGEYSGDLGLDIYTDWGDFSLADCELDAEVDGEDLSGTARCQLDIGWFGGGGGSASTFDFYGAVSDRGWIEGELAIDPGRGDPFVMAITGEVSGREMWLTFSGLTELGGFETEVGGESLLVRTD